MAGLAGVLYAARYGTVNAQAGLGFELEAVGAAVIGGVAIFGGSGTLWGAAFGAYLLFTINRALPVLGSLAGEQVKPAGRDGEEVTRHVIAGDRHGPTLFG